MNTHVNIRKTTAQVKTMPLLNARVPQSWIDRIDTIIGASQERLKNRSDFVREALFEGIIQAEGRMKYKQKI